MSVWVKLHWTENTRGLQYAKAASCFLASSLLHPLHTLEMGVLKRIKQPLGLYEVPVLAMLH